MSSELDEFINLLTRVEIPDYQRSLVFTIAMNAKFSILKRCIPLLIHNPDVYTKVLMRSDLDLDEKLHLFDIFKSGGISTKGSSLESHIWNFGDRVIEWFFANVEPYDKINMVDIFKVRGLADEAKYALIERAYRSGFHIYGLEDLVTNRMIDPRERVNYLDHMHRIYRISVTDELYITACRLQIFEVVQYVLMSGNVIPPKDAIFWSAVLCANEEKDAHPVSDTEIKRLIDWGFLRLTNPDIIHVMDRKILFRSSDIYNYLIQHKKYNASVLLEDDSDIAPIPNPPIPTPAPAPVTEMNKMDLD